MLVELNYKKRRKGGDRGKGKKRGEKRRGGKGEGKGGALIVIIND